MSRAIETIRGIAAFMALFCNLAFWGVIFFTVATMMIVPSREVRRSTRRRLQRAVVRWARGNEAVLRWFTSVRWEIAGVEDLRGDGCYLVIANHQTWLDVFAIHRALIPHLSPLSFFVKQQMIWVPVVGLACRALGFPFMRRHSKETLAKHPELRGQDLDTTRTALRDFGREPESIFNFMEGTRFTPEKRTAQQSPYRHLLKPRSGGVAFVLGSIGDRLEAILDATIVYSPSRSPFWDCLAGRLEWISVHIQPRTIPVEFSTDATFQERNVRERFRQWARDLWHEKDARIEAVLRAHGVDPSQGHEAA